MNPLISVIVPVYNVEQFLPRCVDSIINQSYKNLEIILIDDGSPDNCGKICDEYADKDPRIKVIHQKNGGLSAARNAGLEVAKGTYIGLVDSDDYIAPNMYEKMYETMKATDAELCICGMRWVNEDGSAYAHMSSGVIKNEILGKMDALAKLMQSNDAYYVTTVNKLYHRKLFDGTKFPVGFAHEDEFTIHRFLDQCQEIVCVEDELYFYVQRNGSIMNSQPSIRRLDAAWAMWDRHLFFKKAGYTKDADYALRRGYGIVFHLLGLLPVHKYLKEFVPVVCRFSVRRFPQLACAGLIFKFVFQLLRSLCNAGVHAIKGLI